MVIDLALTNIKKMKRNFLANYFLFVVLFGKVSMKYVLVRIDQNRPDIGADYRQLIVGLPTARNYQ